MKWIRICSAVVVMSMTTVAQAGLHDLFSGFGGHHNGSCKSCGCASDCQPCCCKPKIVRPCCPTVHVYQRKCSDIKPPCCNSCCEAPKCCAPAAKAKEESHAS